ncbi:MAG: hypothetical protein ACLUE2_04625 [Bacteroides cellulosilyticus]
MQRYATHRIDSTVCHDSPQDEASGENDESKTVLQNLACTVVGIITDAARKIIGHESKNRRHIEITLAFKELLSANEQINRNVSYYAESLHISSVYLNEVIKNVTGVSVSGVHSK